jgi:hypothetical protein
MKSNWQFIEISDSFFPLKTSPEDALVFTKGGRVARFFLVQITNTEKNEQNYHKIHQKDLNVANGVK